MKIAVVQMRSTGSKEANIKKALWFIKHAVARKAKFILFPEAVNFRGRIDPRKGFGDVAEIIPGPSIKPLMAAAREKEVAILAGSICEKILGEKKSYNTSVLINSQGKIIAKYRKTHLFTAHVGKIKIRESQYFVPGRKSATAVVDNWRIGLSICYDLRFPEFYRKYKEKGADILCVPSAFTKITGQAHWEVLLRARAVENACYVLAPNQIGKDGKGVMSYGNSIIIDPWGKILARASAEKEEIIFAKLKKRIIKEKRNILGI